MRLAEGGGEGKSGEAVRRRVLEAGHTTTGGGHSTRSALNSVSPRMSSSAFWLIPVEQSRALLPCITALHIFWRCERHCKIMKLGYKLSYLNRRATMQTTVLAETQAFITRQREALLAQREA